MRLPVIFISLFFVLGSSAAFSQADLSADTAVTAPAPASDTSAGAAADTSVDTTPVPPAAGTEIVPVEVKPVEKKPPVKSAENKKPAAKEQNPEEVIAAETTGKDESVLLDINDGDFRYARIEGITLKKKDTVEAAQSDNNANADGKDQNENQNSDLRKSITAWGSIAFIILLLYTVYRLGRKKRKRSVFRRFP